MNISVVIPVYKSEENIRPLCERLSTALTGYKYEVVFVVDGSPDRSFEFLKSESQRDPRIKVLNFSKNFGQHYAITAGLQHCSGDVAIVMDCDLQHDPKEFPRLLQEIKKGYDIVLTRVEKRQFSPVKNLFATLFRKFYVLISGDRKSYEQDIGNFSAINRKVIDSFLRVRDYHRHYLFILKSLGFNVSIIPIEHKPRFAGKSSYTLFMLVRHAVNGIVSQSTRVLYLSVFFGLSFVFVSFLLCAYFVYLYFTHSLLPGWLSIILMMSFFSGVILIFLGVIGVYLAKVFEQVKDRPLFIVSEAINFEEKNARSSLEPECHP